MKAKSIYQKMKDGESPLLINRILPFYAVILIFIPVFITKCSWIKLDYDNTGEIGDIIGGTTAPFIGFVGVLLTFYAFWVQYRANIEQRNDIRLERFENKFYELLRLHRANVEEMNIANKVHGRKVFFHMFYELRFVYWTLHLLNIKLNQSFSDEQVIKLAYKVFFCGIGYNPDKELDYWLSDEEKAFLINEQKSNNMGSNNFTIKKLFMHIQEAFLEKSSKQQIERFVWKLPFIESDSDEHSIEIPYYPFDGHAGRLGHYFRHLFQTVDFIAKQEEAFLSEDDKYEYLKILRAQLSNHEQLILYYNAISGFGEKWITKKYLTKYRFIRNLPIPLADFGIKPRDMFKDEIEEWKAKGKYFFEWDERKIKQ